MARPVLATVDELERLLGAQVSNSEQALARLEQASELVRAFAGVDWLDEAETELVDVPGAIPGVVCGIVQRASDNPEGVTYETAGPFARSFGADAAARIYLTKGEKSIIRHAVGVPALGVISTTRGRMDTPEVLDCWSGLIETDELADELSSTWP